MVRTKKLTNEVFLDENRFVHIVYHGNQTKISLTLVINRAMAIMKELGEQEESVLVLADIRDMGIHTAAGRMAGMRARMIMPFLKMAIVTSKADLYTARISKMMTSMSDRKKEIRYFKSEMWATKWLNK